MARVNLYIEDTEIKLMVSSGNRVDKWASLVLDEGLVDQGMVLEQERVSKAIGELLKMQSVGQGKITLGISGLNSIFRIINIPEVPKNLLAEAVGNEAARVLPVPLSQVYHSYQILPSPKGELNIFLAAYPRESTDILIKTVMQAGLKPDVIDLAPLALARCVNLPRAVIVNSWLTFLDVIILSERIPQVIRSVSLPLESTAIEERIPAVVEEIIRTVTFYNSGNPDSVIDKTIPLVVCGDLARQEENWKPLERLGYPIQIFKPAMEYKEAFDPSQYAVNCGLAMKGQTVAGENNFSMIDFNALPESYRGTPFSWSRVLVPIVVVAALGGLAWGYMTMNSMQEKVKQLETDYANLQAQNAAQRTTNNGLKNDIAAEKAAAAVYPPQITQVQSQTSQLRAQETFFNGLMDGFKNNLSDTNLDIREVVLLCPEEINLESIDSSGAAYSVTGKATSEAMVLAFGRALEDSGRFTTVLVNTMTASVDSATGADIVNFDMTLV